VTCRRSGACSPESAASTSALSEPDGSADGKSRSISFCRHVLEHHWPDVPRYADIRELDWNGVERVDLLAGGFPCQPFSVAGQRRGKDDERWLWPEFAAAVRALRPRHVLVENVPGLLAGHGGMGDVLGDLAQLGYDAEWDSVPAAAVGAPHLRYRVWIVAHADVVGGLRVGGLFDGFRSALGYDADGRRSPLPDADAQQLWLQPAGFARSDGTAIAGDDGVRVAGRRRTRGTTREHRERVRRRGVDIRHRCQRRSSAGRRRVWPTRLGDTGRGVGRGQTSLSCRSRRRWPTE
jgi:site-specific DNA-cytosine methylase